MNERVSGMDEFRVSFVLRGWEKYMHIFFNFSRKERIICILSTIYGGESIILELFLMIRWTKSEPILAWRIHPNLHACGIKALVVFFFIIIAKKSFDLQSSCA